MCTIVPILQHLMATFYCFQVFFIYLFLIAFVLVITLFSGYTRLARKPFD